MQQNELDKRPNPAEGLPDYVRRLRLELGMSQDELAERSGIHPQSIGKIERGQTTRLNSKTKAGLARALKIPNDYLDAALAGVAVEEIQGLKICPGCWKPGSEPELFWLDSRSKFCFMCGEQLRERCQCGKLIKDWHFAFCPYL